MEFLAFIVGIIVGILVRDMKYGIIKVAEKAEEGWVKNEKAQFFEPISSEEKLVKSKTISDFLGKLDA